MIIKKIEMKAGMKAAENMTAGKNGFTNKRELIPAILFYRRKPAISLDLQYCLTLFAIHFVMLSYPMRLPRNLIPQIMTSSVIK
jgi:hypothetical protein